MVKLDQFTDNCLL